MPGHPPLEPHWIDRPHLRCDLGDLPLESGDVLRDAFVSYVVHGDPSMLRESAILATTAIGSTHHRLDFLIGPGNAFDPTGCCIVVADALGNGLSSSPSNSTIQPAAEFPRISIRDMVESQRRLSDHLGVVRWAAVAGASMGGMQALQWAVSHPNRMACVIAMTPMARTARWSQLVNALSRRALFLDDDCRSPRARDEAMRLWTPLTQLVIAQTPDAIEAFVTQTDLLQWIDKRARMLEVDGPDPFDWCCQSHAYDAHDVGTTPGWHGDTRAALQSIRARTLLLAPPLDLYNPTAAVRDAAHAIPGARLVEIPSLLGHRSASGADAADVAFLRDTIASFLGNADHA